MAVIRVMTVSPHDPRGRIRVRQVLRASEGDNVGGIIF
eukprot:CAMPEP_0181188276 /NCGR_PEP_ID=MMETSP1096-20121128/11024_1 /TAXON_ID=156174 ORGANISM="Chrysochromulina ericina, Strain CCMP281" /NCGR_SAMPLE_ID=MMETSP1096 /ASSEMBLY_ACC=CAM_ASM_000453 /LENGTH=37 /DNA_ID= /DNA_START= /DNA_END= /DNA_ORIENTATION=